MLTLIGLQRSPESQTEELDREYLDTVAVQGRLYQKYSIDQRIYSGPIDDVRRESSVLCIPCLTTHTGRSTATGLPAASLPENVRRPLGLSTHPSAATRA